MTGINIHLAVFALEYTFNMCYKLHEYVLIAYFFSRETRKMVVRFIIFMNMNNRCEYLYCAPHTLQCKCINITVNLINLSQYFFQRRIVVSCLESWKLYHNNISWLVRAGYIFHSLSTGYSNSQHRWIYCYSTANALGNSMEKCETGNLNVHNHNRAQVEKNLPR